MQLLFGAGELLPHRVILFVSLAAIACSVFVRLRLRRLPGLLLCDLSVMWWGVQSAVLMLYLMVMRDLLGHIVIRAGGMLALGAIGLLALDGALGAARASWIGGRAWYLREKRLPARQESLPEGEK